VIRFRAFLGLIAALILFAAFPTVAEAHRLKLFVSVEGMTVSGYAFFIGGGRPQEVEYFVKDGAGAEVHRGRTDGEGGFSWVAEKPSDYVLAVDTGDGHFAEEKIPADRFSPDATSATPSSAVSEPTAPSPPVGAAERVAGPGSPPLPSSPLACPAPLDPAQLERLTESAVDRAVARQLRPLIEAQNLAEGRLRFNDIMGGIGMIVGLAGLAAWGLSRRREKGPGA